MAETSNIERVAVLKRSGCLQCGENHPACLEFHHRDPSQKLFSIAEGMWRPWADLKAEILKCDILCANCHRKEHYHRREVVRISSGDLTARVRELHRRRLEAKKDARRLFREWEAEAARIFAARTQPELPLVRVSNVLRWKENRQHPAVVCEESTRQWRKRKL